MFFYSELFKKHYLKKKLFLVFLGPRKIHFPSKLIIFQLASLDTMVMPKSSELKIFVSGKIVNKILFTDFYLGLGRVCKTLFILNTFLGSYIFQYFEAVGWKHLYNVPVLEGFQPHDIWQRQRNPSTARIVFRLVWRRAPPSCMGPLIWSGYHEKAFTKPKNQAKNLKDSKSGLRFFSFLFVLFCFLAADSGRFIKTRLKSWVNLDILFSSKTNYWENF